MSRFLECLSLSLQAETSYRQPVGGPFTRTRRGAHWDAEKGVLVDANGNETDLPKRADGLAFDDDPDDTGGRTCMGILQREYNAYRKVKGESVQDVWRISDEEVMEIYEEQYWKPLKCDSMHPGVDLCVFDSGINCGVGMGARFLQRALGVKDDGHLGLGTMEKLRSVNNQASLIEGIIEAREKYHRACKTFWKHGKGWLERDNATEHEALAMLGHDSGMEISYPDIAQDSRKALPPPPPTAVAETSTGQSAAISGTIGSALTIREAYGMYQQAQDTGITGILTKPENLVPIAIIAVCILIVALARRDWIDRARKMLQGV